MKIHNVKQIRMCKIAVYRKTCSRSKKKDQGFQKNIKIKHNISKD